MHPALLAECVAFRTDIYVSEGYMPRPEQAVGPDCYDPQSSHILVRERKSGRLVAYCRMIRDHTHPLPIVQICPHLEEQLAGGVEISRFSVHADWRGRLSAADMAPFFLLARELLVLSRREHIGHWSCLIDERFQQLCARFFKMHFHILGEPVDYMGSPSIPSIVHLSESIRANLGNSDFTAFWNIQELIDWIDELE
jgi:predicted GNAT family N-acyltransferase